MVKRVSTYLHIAEALLLVLWLNWLTTLVEVSGAVSGPVFLVVAAIIVFLRVKRRRQTRMRQLWER